MSCSVENCVRKKWAKGLCYAHYERLRKWGDLRPELPIQERVHAKGQICATKGCDRLAKAKGRCNAHYDRMRLTGDDRPDQPIKPIRYDWDDICLVEGCSLQSRKLGRCETHYSRWRATGTDDRPNECEVCGIECTPAWDHCHTTGQFRGWLCTRCNIVLGSVKDDPNLLRSLAEYLERQGALV